LKPRRKIVLIFIALVLVSPLLYLYQNVYVFVAAVIGFLFILATVVQLAGYSFRDIFKGKLARSALLNQVLFQRFT
jgi:hypothetical protein